MGAQLVHAHVCLLLLQELEDMLLRYERHLQGEAAARLAAEQQTEAAMLHANDVRQQLASNGRQAKQQDDELAARAALQQVGKVFSNACSSGPGTPAAAAVLTSSACIVVCGGRVRAGCVATCTPCTLSSLCTHRLHKHCPCEGSGPKC